MVRIKETKIIDGWKKKLNSKFVRPQQDFSFAKLDVQMNNISRDESIEHKYAVYRPIQYLGSKVRSLDVISQKVKDILNPGATILDMFTGSTVVAQALADSGYNVIATDAMKYSEVFASALLGIGRTNDSAINDRLVDIVLECCDFSTLELTFGKWIEYERVAIAEGDGQKLINLANTFPQVWRQKGSTKTEIELFEKIRSYEGAPGFQTSSIVTSFYASTYFGIEQAIILDSLRCSIARAKNSGYLNEWSHNVCLTALLSSASLAAFTPGKHFAQYHRLAESKNLDFHRKRILSDRKISIIKEFKNNIKLICNNSDGRVGFHKAMQCTMEDLVLQPDMLGNVDLIYADPPYTAQQYSRFYHIPEVIVKYQVPRLQLVSGRPTVGLYNKDRFKSRFSSKIQAPEAFKDMALLAARHSSDLLVSYSDSKSGVTGNSRMIQLDELNRIFSKYFSSVEVFELDHTYRQFNSNVSAVKEREDREIMIHCS